MKIRYIIASVVLGSLLFTSCGDGISLPNTDNKGKAKPTVGVEITDQTETGFNIKLSPSADVQNYAYAVYATDSEEVPAAPSAYELVTRGVAGTYAANSIIKGDETSKDVKINCILKDYYHVCVAAISKSGLLGEVETKTVHIPGAHPDVTFVNAVYTFDAPMSDEFGSDAFAPGLGGPFDITIAEADPAVYVMDATWFGLFKFTLEGTYDYTDNTLTFDGTFYKDTQGSTFGYICGYANAAQTLGWALFGGGQSGKEPLVLQCELKDKKAYVTSIKSGAIEIDIADRSSGSWAMAGIISLIDRTTKVTLKQEL